MEMLNRVSEIQNLSSIRSDGDALADEMGSVELRLFCLLYGGTNTDTLTSLRYARDMAMVATSNRVVPQLLPATERLAHTIGCVFIFQSSDGRFSAMICFKPWNGDRKWVTISFAS